MSEIERIAAGLNEAQRATVLRQGGTHDEVMDIEPLWTTIAKHENGFFSIGLNHLGRALRAHLQEQTP